MAEPNGGYPAVSGRRSLTSWKGENGEMRRCLPWPGCVLLAEERKREGCPSPAY
jgi:hypothetical protein